MYYLAIRRHEGLSVLLLSLQNALVRVVLMCPFSRQATEAVQLQAALHYLPGLQPGMGRVTSGISTPVQSRPGGVTVMETQSFDPNFEHIKMALVLLQDDSVFPEEL